MQSIVDDKRCHITKFMLGSRVSQMQADFDKFREIFLFMKILGLSLNFMIPWVSTYQTEALLSKSTFEQTIEHI